MWRCRGFIALSCFQEDEKSSFPQHSTDMLVDWLNQRKVRSFYTSFNADSLKEGAYNLMQVRPSLICSNTFFFTSLHPSQRLNHLSRLQVLVNWSRTPSLWDTRWTGRNVNLRVYRTTSTPSGEFRCCFCSQISVYLSFSSLYIDIVSCFLCSDAFDSSYGLAILRMMDGLDVMDAFQSSGVYCVFYTV